MNLRNNVLHPPAKDSDCVCHEFGRFFESFSFHLISLSTLEVPFFRFFSFAAFYDHLIVDHGGKEYCAHQSLDIASDIFDANQLL